MKKYLEELKKEGKEIWVWTAPAFDEDDDGVSGVIKKIYDDGVIVEETEFDVFIPFSRILRIVVRREA